eukprot:363108-Heterocapsa_arctica.AAC.1
MATVQEMQQMIGLMEQRLSTSLSDNMTEKLTITMMGPMMERMEQLTSTLDGLAAQVQENVTKAVMVLMEA